MKFVAIDFETANPCLSSVCQIGVVSFADGRRTHSWKTFINPDDYFADMEKVSGPFSTTMYNKGS
jgi:DNA polymerase-3 subunit epsilon